MTSSSYQYYTLVGDIISTLKYQHHELLLGTITKISILILAFLGRIFDSCEQPTDTTGDDLKLPSKIMEC